MQPLNQYIIVIITMLVWWTRLKLTEKTAQLDKHGGDEWHQDITSSSATFPTKGRLHPHDGGEVVHVLGGESATARDHSLQRLQLLRHCHWEVISCCCKKSNPSTNPSAFHHLATPRRLHEIHQTVCFQSRVWGSFCSERSQWIIVSSWRQETDVQRDEKTGYQFILIPFLPQTYGICPAVIRSLVVV